MGPFSRGVSILIYHRVIPEKDPLFPEQVSAADFDLQMRLLARWFEVLPLAEAINRIRDGSLPRRAACVTFDDGYADNAEIALPILMRHGVPATFFLASGFIDGGTMWNDSVIEIVRAARPGSLDARCVGLHILPVTSIESRRRAIEELLSFLKYLPGDERQRRVDILQHEALSERIAPMMMSTDQVRMLHQAGMEIGAHTVTHPILATLDLERATSEIAESKRQLESITRAPVGSFAYPNGKPGIDYGAEHVSVVKKLGFHAAVTTAWGVANSESDLYQLPRFTPWDRTPGRFLLRLMQNTFSTRPQRVAAF